MKNKKIALFITDEDLSLNTGGVIYVRQVIDALSDCFYKVKVFSVNSENKDLSIKRTFMRDVISRLILHPSVSVFSFFKVLRCLSDVSDVYFHSGKHWFLLLIIKIFYKKLKVTCISDNIEFDLFSINRRSVSVRHVVEKGIRFFSELLSYRLSDKVTFITNDDFERACDIYKLDKERNIVPISVPLKNNLFSKKTFETGLFTGSFAFVPNYEALSILLKQYSSLKKIGVKIVVSGYKLSDVVSQNKMKEYSDVFTFVCSPDKDKMNTIFQDSDFFISPVISGSGMKTKVAESLSYGLPVLGTTHSFIGYSKALETNSRWLRFLGDGCENLVEEIIYFRNNNYTFKDFNELKEIQKDEYSFNAIKNNLVGGL
ncbi:glycosyltransferase [Vibrio rotiferianus]|uniref:glycosyltransferase n=1 Tax=Vibrio rotiferianus TaxID=190895 RepID=UPI00406A7709